MQLAPGRGVLDALLVDGGAVAEREPQGVVVDEAEGQGGLPPGQAGLLQVHRIERRYGAFRRSITLPSHVQADAIEASAQDGVLQIVIPKAEEVHAKRIQVRAGKGKAAVKGKATVTGTTSKNGA